MRDEIGDLQTIPAERHSDRPDAGFDDHPQLAFEIPAPPRRPDHSESSPVERVLRACGVSRVVYRAACEAARRNGSDAGAELIASGAVSEHRLSQAIATCLAIPDERIAASDQILRIHPADPQEGAPRFLKTCDGAFGKKLFLTPVLEMLPVLTDLLARHPQLRSAGRMTTASDVRAHLGNRTLADRADAARLGLAADRPRQSARQVLDGLSFFLGAAVATSAALAVTHPTAFILAVHALSAIMFFACVLLRLLAASSLLRAKAAASLPRLRAPAMHRPYPVYSVLVALHREEGIVAHLVESLKRLEWPRSRLEIKLVCEGDDTATILAAEAAIAGCPHFEVVMVPPSEPRTKPKALNFALPLTRGEFVVLYDAEDEPHPRQLIEAFEAFDEGGDGLACLQAPLTIRNGGRNWFTGLFALEYAALFRGLLPWLSRHDLPLPLGGTSNHFRRKALVEAGGWDSHNVTEDADLGMRLCREGYRIGTIDAPTSETAPERWVDWRNQRTRWMKGWMQSYLVHMRNPALLLRQLGPIGFVVFQILFFGMIASAIAHPFFLAFTGWAFWTIATGNVPDLIVAALFALDLFNIVAGYFAFILLAGLALEPGERRALRRRFVWLYPYWFLISFAAFRAFLQLITDPHKWEKTPHGPEAHADAGDTCRREPVWNPD